MTIKKRLFFSNILMILVPVAATALIGLLCVGFIWLVLINGAGLGVKDSEEFELACRALGEVVEKKLDLGTGLDALDTLLDSNGLTLTVLQDGTPFYTYGEAGENDRELLAAAQALGNDATITQRGRSVYIRQQSARGQDYTVCIFGGNTSAQAYANVKLALALSILVIGLTILLSIFLTNRFLTRFVFQRIAEPLELLSSGVHQLRDGNLGYRIEYQRQDEFMPVCQDFNEMAGRLKASVEQLQQQESSRRELIAGISHDIRSPLTSIQAYVEGLLDGIARTPEAQRKYLETIRAKAEDLSHIVSQLFLFSKLELAEYPEAPRPIALDRTIESCLASLREEYRQKGLLISDDLAPVTLAADPVQIERIVTNLLENSLKYKNKAQGQVWVRLEKTENGCRLSFADDGPGVPEAALPHLFEVFYRSDPARQNPHQGSGLGLAIVAKTVERMGGTVRALPHAPSGLEICMDFPKERMIHGENTDY